MPNARNRNLFPKLAAVNLSIFIQTDTRISFVYSSLREEVLFGSYCTDTPLAPPRFECKTLST